jgi:DNA-binding response OmpR family regulator
MTSPGATTPVLMLDPEIELGRGLTQQLARYGFRVDLALTENAARVCLWHRSYRAMIIVADLSRAEGLLQLKRLREAAFQTWMIVLTTQREDEAFEIVRRHGGDACLHRPFRIATLLSCLESIAHQTRAARDPPVTSGKGR